MVSESELIGRLREFLRRSDLNTTTTATVRRQLENDFGIDLSDRKAFIREQVDLFLQSEHEKDDPEEDEAEQEEEGEEDQKVGAKSEGSEEDEEMEDDEDAEEEKVKHVRNGKDKKRLVFGLLRFPLGKFFHFYNLVKSGNECSFNMLARGLLPFPLEIFTLSRLLVIAGSIVLLRFCNL